MNAGLKALTAEAKKHGFGVSCRSHREHHLRDDLTMSDCLVGNRARPSERGETF